MPVLEIQLLGDVRLTYDQASVAGFHTPRLQALLGWLVLHAGVPQPRARLAYLFWPDSNEEQAHTNLRKALFDLRRALPDAEHFLCLERATVQWNREGRYVLDVATFEAALHVARTPDGIAHAVELYGGDLLPGCYDDWVLPERDRLRDAFTQLLDAGIALHEAERDYQTAIGYAQRLCRHEPLYEAAYRTLMRLYALAGQRAAALRTYHTCAAVLQRDLEVEPSSTTRETYERLLNREAPAPSAPVAMPMLVGRAGEWAALQRAWRSAAGGEARAVLIVGDAGIGKTRLAEELRDWAERQGLATAVAHCYGSEGMLAYAPVTALLRCLRLPPLEPVWLAEVARLLPEIATGHPDLPRPGPLTEPWQRQRFFEALARALLSHQPLLVVVDDLHWCDRDSLDWLHYLLRFDAGARLLVVATLRPEGIGAEGERAALWPDLRAAGRLQEIEPAPLDRRDTAMLAQRLSTEALDEARLAQLYEETEGNPLFVLEMVRAGLPGTGALPPTIRAVLAARLAQLSAGARELAAVAATVGRAFRFDVLQHASGQADDDVARGLDELWRRRIVREQDQDGYDFSHDKLREAAYAQLSAARRRLAHRRVAEALEEICAGDLDTASAPIAAHLEQAGLDARAAQYHVRAGDAARFYANAAAEAHYQRALELLPRQEQIAVVCRLGELWQETGKLEEAAALYQRSESLAAQAGDELAAAQCRCGRGSVLRIQGLYTEALEACEKAHTTFTERGDRAGQCTALMNIGIVHVEQTAFERALECFEQAAALATALDDHRALGRAMGRIASLYLRQGRFAQALGYLERQLAHARTIGDRVEMVKALANMGHAYLKLNDYPRALDMLRRALDESLQCGIPPVNALGNMALLYWWQGDLAGALSLAEQGALLAMETGYLYAAATLIGYTGYILIHQGRLDEAERRLTRAVALLERLNLRPHLCDALHYQAELRARQHDPDRALPVVERALQVATDIDYRENIFDVTVLGVRLRLMQQRGDTAAAIAELERMLPAWPQDLQRATLHYELWRLDRTREADRRAAAEFYRDAHACTPKLEFRERFYELTGERLPEPPPLPAVAAHVARQPGDIDALLDRMDRVIAERAAAQIG